MTAASSDSDPVVSLGTQREELLAKREEFARQWQAASNIPTDPQNLALDLTTEIEYQAEVVIAELSIVETKIAEAIATTPSGLSVKLRLLRDICCDLDRNFDADLDDQSAFQSLGEDEDPQAESWEPRGASENVELLEKLSATAFEDAKKLFG